MENLELDALLKEYRQAVEEWIARIREESALATEEHSVKALDAWEAASFREEEARKKAKAAKIAYEDASRRTMFKI